MATPLPTGRERHPGPLARIDAGPLREDPAGLRALAAREGCLYLPRLLPVASVLALRERVLAAVAGLAWLDPGAPWAAGVVRGDLHEPAHDDAAVAALHCRVLPLAEFRALVAEPALLAVLDRLFGAPARGGQGEVLRAVFPADQGRTTPPHQDQAYTGGAADLWTAWLPLGDCPLELGPLALAPGSHRGGLRPHTAGYRVADCADLDWVCGDLACGDVLLFHCLTLHRACPNRSGDRLRLSLDCRYRPVRFAAPAPSD